MNLGNVGFTPRQHALRNIALCHAMPYCAVQKIMVVLGLFVQSLTLSLFLLLCASIQYLSRLIDPCTIGIGTFSPLS